MTIINAHGYLCAITGKNTKRNWWLVKYRNDDIKNTQAHGIPLGVVSIPSELVGKKIMFKVEVVS